MHQQRHTTVNSHIDVSLEQGGIILCVLVGDITEELVKKSMSQTGEFAAQVRQNGKTPLLLIDASHVTSQTSGARTQAKTLGQMGIEKIAVAGPSPGLSFVVQYLIRSGGMAKYARIFRTQAGARRWLKSKEPVKAQPYNRRLGILLALITAVLSVAALVGWATNNEILTAVVPGIKPMNPVSAATFIVLAIGAILLRRYGTGKGVARVVPFLAAWWAIIFGLTILVRRITGLTIPIDTWLFTDAIAKAGAAGGAAPRSAIMFVLVGVMILLVLTGQTKRWQRGWFHAAGTLVFITALGAIFNYSFGLQSVVGAAPSIRTAICFLLINHALQLVARRTPFYETSLHIFNRYSPAIFVSIAMILITGVAWQQSKSDVDRAISTAERQASEGTQSAITDRLNGYVNALRGYRSFFEASENVHPHEFRTYFEISELKENYPGFNAITFVQSVPASQRQSFNAQLRQYASAQFPKYATSSVFPVTNLPVMYPTTLVAPATPTTLYGFDLNSNQTRRETLERARDTGDIAASDIIDLNAARADSSLPKRPGFYITIPVYAKPSALPTTIQERRARIYGFVNAVLEVKVFFGDVFKNATQNSVKYVIRSARSGEVLYTQNGSDDVQPEPKQRQLIAIADQALVLETYTAPFFGMSGLSPHAPSIIIASGGAFTLLAALLMIGQLHRRDNAVHLAESMTEDLNHERNIAVATQQKDEAILSSIGDAVFAVNTKGNITLFNPAAEKISGYTQQEAVGKSYRDILHFVGEKKHSTQDTFITEALAGKLSKMRKHTMLVRKDGRTIPVADSAAPIRDAHGNLLGAIIVFRDVTKELALDRAKDEFISVASHQLRTPLGSIRWNLELLVADLKAFPKTHASYIQEAYNSTLRMLGLVSDLLSVARIEQNRVQDMPQKTNLAKTIRQAVTEMQPIAKQRQVTIATGALQNKTIEVTIDEKRFREVVQNLLSNAVKYTPANGTVTLGATQNTADVVISVADTGIGIPPDEHTKLFAKFYRAKNVTTTDTEGSGLGLFVVKSYVEGWGGKIWFTSTLNKGTTFYVSIPRKPHTHKQSKGL